MKLTIKRSKWIRGVPNQNVASALRTEEGLQCCLGFLARECGAKKKDITNVCLPMDTDNFKWVKGILKGKKNSTDSNITQELICLNDSHTISEYKREKKLKKVFALIGIKVKFVD